MVVSTATGAASRITISGDAAPLLDAVLRDYIGADAHGAAEALPAMVRCASRRSTSTSRARRRPHGQTAPARPRGRDAPGHDHLRHRRADPARVRIGDLADILRDELPKAGYQVLSGAATWGIRLTATAAGATSPSPAISSRTSRPTRASTPARPGERCASTGATASTSRRGVPLADRRLRAAEAGHQTANQALTPAFLGVTDLTAVTSVELCEGIRRMLRAAPTVRVRCDLDVHPDHDLTPMFRRAGRVRGQGRGVRPHGLAGDLGGRRVRPPPPLDRRRRDLGARPGVPCVGPLRGRRGDRGGGGRSGHGARRRVLGRDVRPDGRAALPIAERRQGVDAGRRRSRGRKRTARGRASIALDPAAPGHVYVGTELGVFRSTDAGSTFTPFNEGLPNAPVVDLAFEPTTRMLRAGLWGRGVYERHVGERPPKDVRLYIRSTALDDGTAQPYPGPDLLASRRLPCGSTPHRTSSRRAATRVGACCSTASSSTTSCGTRTSARARPSSASSCTTAARSDLDCSRGRALGAGRRRSAAARRRAPGRARRGPLAANASFGAWTVIADDLLPDPHNAGHPVVAPGYPRIAVVGAPPRGSPGAHPTSRATAGSACSPSAAPPRMRCRSAPPTCSTSCAPRRRPPTASARS